MSNSDSTSPIPESSIKSHQAARSRGGRNGTGKTKRHSQKRDSLLTPSGGSWLQMRADWETGMFTVADLAHAYGVNRKTLEYRMRRDVWGPRPTGPIAAKALPGLVEALSPDGVKDEETIEATIAVLEGREVDPDALAQEKGKSQASRKAIILRDHRDFTKRYRGLLLTAMGCLEDYGNGKLRQSFVRGTGPEGNEVILSFNLFSRQSGFIDVVDKVGGILERTIKLERLSHGLESVDGTGAPRAPGAGDGAAPLGAALRGKTNDELDAMLSTMLSSFEEPHRQSRGAPGA